jgi:hypothetical protein
MAEFSDEDVALLRVIDSIPVVVIDKLTAAPRHDVLLSDEEYDVFVTAVGEHLTTFGFDADYRPNALGAALEHLIDLITTSRS